MNNKFDVETMKRIRDDIDLMHYKLTSCRQDCNQNGLIDGYELMCRVSGMLSDVIVQSLEGEIGAAEPQGYIQNKLAQSKRITDKLYDKYYTESRS